MYLGLEPMRILFISNRRLSIRMFADKDSIQSSILRVIIKVLQEKTKPRLSCRINEAGRDLIPYFNDTFNLDLNCFDDSQARIMDTISSFSDNNSHKIIEFLIEFSENQDETKKKVESKIKFIHLNNPIEEVDPKQGTGVNEVLDGFIRHVQQFDIEKAKLSFSNQERRNSLVNACIGSFGGNALSFFIFDLRNGEYLDYSIGLLEFSKDLGKIRPFFTAPSVSRHLINKYSYSLVNIVNNTIKGSNLHPKHGSSVIVLQKPRDSQRSIGLSSSNLSSHLPTLNSARHLSKKRVDRCSVEKKIGSSCREIHIDKKFRRSQLLTQLNELSSVKCTLKGSKSSLAQTPNPIIELKKLVTEKESSTLLKLNKQKKIFITEKRNKTYDSRVVPDTELAKIFKSKSNSNSRT